jgi:hypothetical protein
MSVVVDTIIETKGNKMEERRVARGVIAFEYRVAEHPEAEGLDNDELVSYFLDTMVDDVIDMRFSDIRPAIDMEVLYG